MFKAFIEPFRQPRPVLDSESLRSGGQGKPKARAKNWSGTLGRIWSYLSRRKVKLSLVLLMVFASSALALLGPYMVGIAIDQFIAGEATSSSWAWFLLGLAAVYVLFSLTSWLQNIWMIEIAQETVFRMRYDLFAHLHKLPIPFFGKRQQGEIMSRVTNDIENVSSTLNSSAIQIFSSVLTLIGTLGVMLWLSPLLTLLKERQRNLGELNGYIEETLSGQRIIKAFSQEERVIRGFEERNMRIRISAFWAQTISGFIPKLMNGLNNLSFAIVAGIGGILAIQGSVTVGVIIIFVEYARQFTRPLNDLANQWNTLLSAIAGAERVFEVLDEDEESKDEGAAIALDHMLGNVRFDKVSFGYDEGRDILRDISFEAKPGEMIALVGPTGAGKTTLIQLLSRFYDPTSGTITVDGHKVTTIRRENLRSHMAFVLQDSFLFQGTIRENIRFGRLDASDEEVEIASKLANAHSFIMRMKNGYDRVLQADGSGISQGQKQLLAIARAILADPSILVLDEATSSIDTVTEIKIQEGLERLMHGRTSFVIAHRLNTIRQADRILVLKDGRLLEQGSHDELLKQGGFYSELYNSQLRKKAQ
jgi:ATP-binding cassette subfamily B protein